MAVRERQDAGLPVTNRGGILIVSRIHRKLESPAYMIQASESCFWLLTQVIDWALSLARLKAGSNIAAKMAMMAITTRSSMRVKARR